jgi:hypothetical protein
MEILPAKSSLQSEERERLHRSETPRHLTTTLLCLTCKEESSYGYQYLIRLYAGPSCFLEERLLRCLKMYDSQVRYSVARGSGELH